jgi:hypothetical protein
MKSLTVCPHSQTHHQDPHYILQQDQTLLKIRRTRLQKLLSVLRAVSMGDSSPASFAPTFCLASDFIKKSDLSSSI